MKTYQKGQGYLMNDNRASGGKLEEADVLTCTHCQKVLLNDDWKEDGGFCGQCMHPVCGKCADLMLVTGCTPFVKKIEKSLSWIDKHRDEYQSQFHGSAGVPEGE